MHAPAVSEPRSGAGPPLLRSHTTHLCPIPLFLAMACQTPLYLFPSVQSIAECPDANYLTCARFLHSKTPERSLIPRRLHLFTSHHRSCTSEFIETPSLLPFSVSPTHPVFLLQLTDTSPSPPSFRAAGTRTGHW
jgi:hypothetical protein